MNSYETWIATVGPFWPAVIGAYLYLAAGYAVLFASATDGEIKGRRLARVTLTVGLLWPIVAPIAFVVEDNPDTDPGMHAGLLLAALSLLSLLFAALSTL